MSIVARSARLADGQTTPFPTTSSRGADRGREVPAALARRGRPAAREGDRHVLDLHGRARPQRLDVHRARRRLDRRRLRRRALVGGRRALRPAARRRARVREADARGGRRDWATPRRWVQRRARRAASGSWASATASTAPRIRARASSSGPRRSSARRTIEVAEELERAALAELQERNPDRVLATNVEYYSAVVLDVAEIPPPLAPAMFACSRVAGWSAHILEQKRTGPAVQAVGPVRRPRAALAPAGVTLAEAAAEADALAQAGRRAGARDAPRAVGRRDRGGRAQRRLPHSRRRLPRDRAVPLPAEARAAAPGPRGREPGGARLGADRARGALARPSGRRQRVPAAAPRARCARPERRRAAPRDRLPEERHAAARHDPAPRRHRGRRRGGRGAAQDRALGRRALLVKKSRAK